MLTIYKNLGKTMIETLKIIAGVMGLVGVPPIFALVTWSIGQINKIRKENKEREQRQTKALQIMLRSDLMKYYKEAMARGKITDEDLQLWEDEYQVYHNMGKNGVMDSKRDKMLELQIVDHY